MNRGDVIRHVFSSKDDLFFDANVWLYIYGPSSPSDRLSRIYSKVLADALHAKSRLHVNVLILSEFANTFARLLHKQSAYAGAQFKAYRKTPEFAAAAKDIAANMRRILRHCTAWAPELDQDRVPLLIDEFALGANDFNDLLIGASCADGSLTLVTHDADFGATGLNILSANRRLLGP